MSKKTAKKKVAKKKVTKKTASRKTAANQAQDYAHEIWLAGLGAFSLAQDEGSKVFKQSTKAVEDTRNKVLGESAKLFDRLVKEGTKLEKKGRKAANDAVDGVKGDVESRVGRVRGDVESRVEKVREQAQTNWDKLEKVFEQRVARALSRLGVPTSDEISELSDRVAELNKRVAAMNKASAEKKAPAKKTASTDASKAD
jgi:poly(hydroxyalkanoate) granule-associated protein